jgi:hypothetical protein
MAELPDQAAIVEGDWQFACKNGSHAQNARVTSLSARQKESLVTGVGYKAYL